MKRRSFLFLPAAAVCAPVAKIAADDGVGSKSFWMQAWSYESAKLIAAEKKLAVAVCLLDYNEYLVTKLSAEKQAAV